MSKHMYEEPNAGACVQIRIEAHLYAMQAKRGAVEPPVPCVVHVGMSEDLFDHLGEVRLLTADLVEDSGLAHSQGWYADDANVGDFKISSVEIADQASACSEWLNKNIALGELEISIDCDSATWTAKFPDGRELAATARFDQLRHAFGRAPLADRIRAAQLVCGYGDAASVRKLCVSDKRFAAALEELLPGFQPADWRLTSTVSEVLAEAAELNAALRVGDRDKSIATLKHFGKQSPVLPLYESEPRFAGAIDALLPGFQPADWHRQDTIESVLVFIERESKLQRQHPGVSL